MIARGFIMKNKFKQIIIIATTLIMLLGITLFASGCGMPSPQRRVEFHLGNIGAVICAALVWR